MNTLWKVTGRATARWGDPATDARMNVVRQASGYKFPGPARTRAEALSAFYSLLRMAAKEDPKNSGHYMRTANEAALKLASAPVWNILQTAVDLTKGSAPRTSVTAKSIYVASTKASPGVARTSSSSSAATPAEPISHEHASTIDWGAPWVKVAGAGVLAGLAAWALWPQRRAVPA